MTTYKSLFFIQGDEAHEILNQIEEHGLEWVIEYYLATLDNEGLTQDIPYHGNTDFVYRSQLSGCRKYDGTKEVFRQVTAILAWNPNLPYVGLEIEEVNDEYYELCIP
jgi:hypothetical protein